MPVSIKDKHDCFGCSACRAICPTNAIQMTKDEEGFFYPEINTEKCVNCEQCVRVCPMKNRCENEFPLNIFAARNKNMQVRMRSSSGGVFSELAQYVEQKNGVVYGAAFDENKNVVHERATGNQWRHFCESKYVQSDMRDSYRSVRDDLKSGRFVLFSGTPCQVDGLKSFLTLAKVPQDNLLTIDIVCHGTPSPAIWQDWLKWKAKEQAIREVHFRDKKEVGWHHSTLTLISGDGKEIAKEPQSKGVFWKLFFNHIILKPACGNCPYASFKRVGDFTLGDYWGIEKHYPQMDDDKGTSLLMVNTQKAKEVWMNIQSQFDFCDVKISECEQPNLKSPSKHSPQRSVFWQQYKKHGFEYASKYIGLMETTKREKVLLKLKRKCKSLFKKLGLAKA